MAAALALVLTGTAAAQSIVQPLLGVTGEVVIEPPASQFVVNRDFEDNTKHPEICGSNRFQIDNASRSFRFVDEQVQTQCGELRILLQIPLGVTGAIVEFTADRTIQRANDAVPQDRVATVAIAELRVYGPTGEIVSVNDIVPPGTGSHGPRSFSIPIRFPDGADIVYVAWTFEDRGITPVPGTFGTGSGDAYSSTIVGPVFRIPGIAVRYGASVWKTSVADAGNLTTTEAIAIDVPSVEGATSGSYQVAVHPSVQVVEFRAPDNSTIPVSRLDVAERPDGIVYTLPRAIVGQHGAGTYAIVTRTVGPIPPPPPPPPPATIYPLILALLATPAVPGAMAARAGLVYRREATGAYQRTALVILGTILTLIVLWALALVYAFPLGRLGVLATLPLEPEAWVVNVLLVALAVGLAALWFVPSRYALVAMRADLAERRKQAQELKRSNLELEHFAYIASHDLQEPLRTISGFAQLLERRYGTQLDDRGKMYIQRQVAGTKRMQTLINDLLAYSRVQTQGKPFESVDLDVAVDTLLQDLESFIAEREATVTKERLPTVRCDASQIVQVFSNLVRNAIKYRSPDRRPVVAIHFHDDPKARETVFSVADNGKGIAPEYFERIFIIFQRLEAREDEEHGTGLGLAITKKIIERHGGRIWVESKVGVGSVFHFAIPYEPGETR